MQFLFKAIACKELEGKKYLFPGYALPDAGEIILFKPGDRIRVEKQDGTLAETTVQGVRGIFDVNLKKKLQLRVDLDSKSFFAIEVPPDFKETGNVYLIDPNE